MDLDQEELKKRSDRDWVRNWYLAEDAAKRSAHEANETNWAFILVMLIPLGFIGYALVGWLIGV